MARKHKSRAYPPERAFRNHTTPPDALLAAAQDDPALSETEETVQDAAQEAEEELEEVEEAVEASPEIAQAANPPLEEIARIESADRAAIFAGNFRRLTGP